MRSFGTVLAAAAAVALAGCAAQVVKTGPSVQAVSIPAASSKRVVLNMSGSTAVRQSKDWEPFKGEWRSALQSETSAAGMTFAVQDGEPKPTGEAGTLVAVLVNDYRYLSTGARYGLGVFAGNAFVDAKVRFLDLNSGRVYGEQALNTSSSAWQGIFSAMTDKQVQAIAKDIVGEIKPR